METRRGPSSSSPKQAGSRSRAQYLIAYNSISCALWIAVLGRLILLVPLVGFENVYGGVGDWTKWTQTLALAEVLHSVVGLVRAPVLTTAMQVVSRVLLVWPVLTFHPDETQQSAFYLSMLLAWSITEVIRYSYFAISLNSGSVPGWLIWLRYNTFYVLYPLGITSESVLIYKASVSGETSGIVSWAFWAVLALYVPGSYILYTHMIKQRRRVMRGKD